ncbi:MAG: bifunctional glutamate N-acetyltransferase/amino-acid acetyltransferase ArgJ [Phycisphaerae bacterium]|nr:bifunctional glutamate N-acetyltransferase/amino-acid acetyltransferase ArgJ [Phycisphaerae bacterium]
MSHARHITLPKGFLAAGVACGIKPSGKKDLAVIAAEADCSVAFVTTSNQITGAPIQYVRRTWPGGCGKARGIVINAGVSNVCTGAAGLRDATTMAKLAARNLGAAGGKFLVASTGVIGRPLPMAKIRRGIAAACRALSARHDADALEAIMTTDTRPKSAVVMTTLDRKRVTVAGMVKGAGMIAPSLATMIGVITTDAAVPPATLHRAIKACVHDTFNAVTVDSDQSTSDIVAVFASGRAGNAPLRAGSRAYAKFTAALHEVCAELARAVAADGEGATRLIEVVVTGAKTPRDAEAAAKSVANSPLVKTAVHGADPNWGRIAMALGKSTAKISAETLTIHIAGQKVFTRGKGCPFNEKSLSRRLREPTVTIHCSLGAGKAAFTALTCDLSKDYITINADYTT